MDTTITDLELTEFVRRAEEAADAFVQGDVDRRAAEFEGWRSPFRKGEARLEQVETHAWGDTVVLVMIERQHAQLGDLPGQNVSLRVTHVYRRDGSDWRLIHRHADPLVQPMELPELNALMRR
jgi:ketosteroid isomerase-like protein